MTHRERHLRNSEPLRQLLQVGAEEAVALGAQRQPVRIEDIKPMLAETSPQPFSREGWLYAWHVGGKMTSRIEWDSFRHDARNTGNAR